MSEQSFAEKLSDSVEKIAGEEVRQEVMPGSEVLESEDLQARANWACHAMEKLDRLVPDDSQRRQIMTGCSCRCQDGFFDEFREAYLKHGDIDRLIDMLYGRAFLVRPVREGNTIYITKAPKHPEEHANVTTPEEKRYYFCHCDNARALTGDISLTYCYCGAGWCQRIWEAILERPVKVDIVRSVLQGDEVCKFAVHI